MTKDKNSKKAWEFLKAFRDSNAPMNIVAIHPVTEKVEAITEPVNDKAILEFIEKRNGTHSFSSNSSILLPIFSLYGLIRCKTPKTQNNANPA